MRILNFGSLNLDYVYHLDHIAKPGETIHAESFQTFAGGKGLNQSIALVRAGVSVSHAGCIGPDGKMLVELCHENGIDAQYIRMSSQQTGHAIIQVDANGQNCIVLFGGANRTITKAFVDEVLKDFSAGDMILLQNEINLLDYIIDQAYAKQIRIAMNPSPFDDNLRSCDLSKVSIFLLNEVEGNQFTTEREPLKIMAKMAQVYPEALVVLTLGENGVLCRRGDMVYSHGIYRVDTIDTTAAGDTFTGFFLASILVDPYVENALALASKASALAVSKKGASDSIPCLKEVLEAKLSSMSRD